MDTEQRDDSARAHATMRPSRAVLRFTRATTGGFEIEVGQGGITIGRTNAECDVGIADPGMSSRHARIAPQDTEWFLHDLDSRNGCFTEGVPLAPGGSVSLGNEAVIRFGDTVAVFTVAGAERGEHSDSSDFPGVSSRAVQVRQRIHQLANGIGHVLILGETGTGKERVARAIGAATRAFVPQNCAELSGDLARSEVFGHVRGAFSGATATRMGLVELAKDGALFLDEVGELPLDVQADLLRFLEDGHYRPVGSTELRHSSARVIAATNVDLDRAVGKGAFRRDLLARLRSSNRPLELPALRDRREDIYDWSLRFLAEAVDEVPAMPWSAGALECLLLYPWPENLRELRGVVRGAREMSSGWSIAVEALPEKLQEHRRTRRASARPEAAATPNPTREEIVAVLLRVHGKMRTAAEELHIDRTKLYRLCDKLKIDLEQFRTGE